MSCVCQARLSRPLKGDLPESQPPCGPSKAQRVLWATTLPHPEDVNPSLLPKPVPELLSPPSDLQAHLPSTVLLPPHPLSGPHSPPRRICEILRHPQTDTLTCRSSCGPPGASPQAPLSVPPPESPGEAHTPAGTLGLLTPHPLSGPPGGDTVAPAPCS